ncbi:MAG: FtsX-like permease family protein, partial [Chlorobi bacterium]|nr:FtsX-like permease family protein [Chlorobiota bacterium]
FLRSQWTKLSDMPMNYEFAEDRLNYLYKNEIRFEKLINFFTAIAILISTMGLFGLVMFSVQRRTKEIGIRKVLGASVFDILKFLSKDFIILVLLGAILAFPIAYYFMNNWLENFAYRIKITPEIFIISIISVLLITLITISLQGIKSAFANPVDSLKDE